MAANTNVEICNAALDHFGKPTITSLTEGSTTAQLCRRHYEPARRGCLAASPWTFARGLTRASLLTNDLPDLWSYRYDIPNDSLKLHQIMSEAERPSRGTPPTSFFLANGSVYTEVPNAYLLYVTDNENTQSWSQFFDDAVALAMARRMAPSLTRRRSDVDALRDAAQAALEVAIEHDAAQEHSEYTTYEGGYSDTFGASYADARRQADGSTIWD